MFDVGWPEMLVIAIVLIVVVGPKDLPRMLRTFGRTTAKLRAMAGDFRKQFDEALKEAELDDVKSLVDDARKLDPRNEIRKHLNPIEKAGQDIRAGLDAAMKPQPARTAAPDTSPAGPVESGAAHLPGGKPPGTAAKAPARKTAAKKPPAKKPAAGKAPARPAASRAKAAAGKKTNGAAS